MQGLLTTRVCALTGAYPFVLCMSNSKKNTAYQGWNKRASPDLDNPYSFAFWQARGQCLKWHCPQKHGGMRNSITPSTIIAFQGKMQQFSTFIRTQILFSQIDIRQYNGSFLCVIFTFPRNDKTDTCRTRNISAFMQSLKSLATRFWKLGNAHTSAIQFGRKICICEKQWNTAFELEHNFFFVFEEIKNNILMCQL